MLTRAKSSPRGWHISPLSLGRSELMSHRFKKLKKPKALPSAEEFAARHGIRIDTSRAIVEQAEEARNPRRLVASS